MTTSFFWQWGTSYSDTRQNSSLQEDKTPTLLKEIRKLREFNARIMKEVRGSREAKAELKKEVEKQQRKIEEQRIEMSMLRSDVAALQERVTFLERDLNELSSTGSSGGDIAKDCSADHRLILAEEVSSWESIKRLAQLLRPQHLLSGLTPSQFTPVPTVTVPLPSTNKDYTIILDLDETQMHFSMDRYPNKKVELRFRPGAEIALQRFCRLRDQVEFGLWTAGVPRYATSVRELLTMLAKENEIFDWTIARDSSWSTGCGYKKDITALNRDPDRVLLIDNTPKVIVQKESSLVVSNFYSQVKGSNDQTFQIITSLVEELVCSGLSVPQFLSQKSDQGWIHSHSGYYYVPNSWNPEAIRQRSRDRRG